MDRKTKRNLLFILVVVLLEVIGFGIILPVMPALLMQIGSYNISDAAFLGGYLLFVYASLLFIFGPIMGGLSDRYGRRPIILASLLTISLDYVLLAIAPTVGWLVVGRIIGGIAGSTLTTAHAYIADITSKNERARSFGLLGAAMGLGFILGPAIGGFLGTVDPRMPFKVAAAIVGVTFLVGLKLLPESLEPAQRRKFDIRRANPFGTLRKIRSRKWVGSLIFVVFFIEAAGQAYPSTWAYFTTEVFRWNSQDIGISLMVFGLLMVLVQGGLVGPLCKKVGEVKTAYLGFFCALASFAGVAFLSSPWVLYAIMPVMALGKLADVGVKTLMSQQVPENAQGELQGATTSVASLVAFISPLLMTQIFGFFSRDNSPVYFPGAPYLAAGTVALLGLLQFASSVRRYSRAPNPQSEGDFQI